VSYTYICTFFQDGSCTQLIERIEGLTFCFSQTMLRRPGILADVAERIASRGMSLEDVTTTRRMSKTGQREFVIDVLASSPNIKDKENLDQCISEIASMETDFQLTHFDVRVHTA
jgi:glycine cleavage system regulatory protein